MKKTKGTGQKCIVLSTLANWLFCRNKLPRYAGVMNSVIKDVEIRRNPIDLMELDMTDWAADVIGYLNYSLRLWKIILRGSGKIPGGSNAAYNKDVRFSVTL